MTTDAEHLRSQITEMLADLPDPPSSDTDIDTVASRLEQAHDVLVDALESVDKASTGGSPTVPGYGR